MLLNMKKHKVGDWLFDGKTNEGWKGSFKDSFPDSGLGYHEGILFNSQVQMEEKSTNAGEYLLLGRCSRHLI